jgi:hypothetical protein
MRKLSIALALVLAGCSVAPSAPLSAPAGSGTAIATPVPAAAPAPPRDIELVERAEDLATAWVGISGTAISHAWIAWIGWNGGDPHKDPMAIGIRQRAGGEVRVFRSAPAGYIGFLRISDEWAAWVEYTDNSQVSDWVVKAASLPDGPPVTLARAAADAQINDRPELAIVGDTLFVTARPSGATRHQLLAIDLRTQQARVVYQAGPGETLGLPTADAQRVAFESHSAAGDAVVVMGEGAAIRVGSTGAPASEPALTGGWLAYKASVRSSPGPIVVRDLATGAEVRPVEWGSGFPVASGSLFVWKVFDSIPVGATRGAPLFAYDGTTGQRWLVALGSKEAHSFASLEGRTIFFSRVFELDGRRQEVLRLVTLP